MKKSYKLKTGSCTECTLYRECQKGKKELLRFLSVLDISGCGDGQCVIIGEINSDLKTNNKNK